MDIWQAIRDLRAEAARLDAVIELVEALDNPTIDITAPLRRRGRKSLGEAERRKVSDRMKKYWAARRR
jgi:hypothetical protein